jgi:hypothetical protein
MKKILNLLALMAALVLLACCRTTRAVEMHQALHSTATSRDTACLRDSVYVLDSIRVEVAGDTVQRQVYRIVVHDRWHERVRTDTLTLRDTIRSVVTAPSDARRARAEARHALMIPIAIGVLLALLVAILFRRPN